jgi:hypothetical protein
MMNALVGDEIQRRENNVRRGGDRAGGKVMLTTYLTDLHPGVSSHT